MHDVVVNTRSLTYDYVTGTQRYTIEILKRLEDHVDLIAPSFFAQGLKGHLWEQVILPSKTGKRVLWSPANTGPLAIRNQVITIYDLSVLEHPEWFSTSFSLWYRYFLPKLANITEKILTISEYSKEQIIRNCGVAPEKIIVTYLSADRRFSPKSNDEIDIARNKVGIPGTRYILALGSLEPRKNLKRLLVAWSSLYNHLPDDMWLVLAGAKGKDTIFRDVLFDNLPPRVYLPGYVPEKLLPAVISGADAFVYPSLYEGFGLPPLEAMACGTPVLTSNKTSLPEVTGDAALLVDPYDVNSIKECLKQLVEDDTLRKQLKLRGLEQAKKFSWEQTAEQTWRVLQEVAEQIQ